MAGTGPALARQGWRASESDGSRERKDRSDREARWLATIFSARWFATTFAARCFATAFAAGATIGAFDPREAGPTAYIRFYEEHWCAANATQRNSAPARAAWRPGVATIRIRLAQRGGVPRASAASVAL